MSRKYFIAIGAVLAVLVLAILSFYFRPRRSVVLVPGLNNGETQTPSTSTPPVVENGMAVSIALLKDAGVTNGPNHRGCDEVVMVDRQVPRSSMPLTVAIQELFKTGNTESGLMNFIEKSNQTTVGSTMPPLAFEKASVDTNGLARIDLKGDVYYAGVCDNSRLRAQIEMTALQFSSVQKVEIYLNGTLYQEPNMNGE